jgi:hypothetical protein
MGGRTPATVDDERRERESEREASTMKRDLSILPLHYLVILDSMLNVSQDPDRY